MKNNEYNAAEAVEIGKADEVILGQKINFTAPDSTGEEPLDKLYVEP